MPVAGTKPRPRPRPAGLSTVPPFGRFLEPAARAALSFIMGVAADKINGFASSSQGSPDAIGIKDDQTVKARSTTKNLPA